MQWYLEIYSDDILIKDFPGFTNGCVNVNGVKLNYVEGSRGKLLLCLPGSPQTRYPYHSVATELSTLYRVIIVDITGIGSSEKPG